MGAACVDPAEAEQRLAERDQREAADTRTAAQKWLNDPPPDRSALARGPNNVARPSIGQRPGRIRQS